MRSISIIGFSRCREGSISPQKKFVDHHWIHIQHAGELIFLDFPLFHRTANGSRESLLIPHMPSMLEDVSNGYVSLPLRLILHVGLLLNSLSRAGIFLSRTHAFRSGILAAACRPLSVFISPSSGLLTCGYGIQ